MQLCLMIEGQEGVTWADWLAVAQACERHGISTLFRSDHYMNLDLQHPDRGSLDAWATICALAAVTTQLRLGTMVSPATFRHPSQLAKVVVTADHVSGGRVELGIGAGWHEREHEAYGFPYPPTRTRMDVLEEQLGIVLGSWTEDNFSFEGEHYTLRDLNGQPKPVQRPHPPLLMGGSGGPRSAAMAARHADEYNTPFPTLDDIAERREQLRRACEAAGREMLPFSIMTGVLVAHSEDELRARAKRLGEKMGADPAGLVDDPPAGWVVGTIPVAIEQLNALSEAGVARVMCQQLLHDDLEHVALLGEELAPQLA